jgi:uncharacterized membrane protein YfhO
MTVSLAGSDTRGGHLVVSKNWYPDWHATVDDKSATARRANHSLLSVDLPAGGRQAELWFDSPAYARGKLLNVIALLAALLMTAVGFVLEWRATVTAS